MTPRQTPPRVPLVLEEVVVLLEAATARPFDYTFVATLLATGLRVSEACHLQGADIDSRAGVLHVRRGKGAKPRSVNLGTSSPSSGPGDLHEGPLPPHQVRRPTRLRPRRGAPRARRPHQEEGRGLKLA